MKTIKGKGLALGIALVFCNAAYAKWDRDKEADKTEIRRTTRAAAARYIQEVLPPGEEAGHVIEEAKRAVEQAIHDTEASDPPYIDYSGGAFVLFEETADYIDSRYSVKKGKSVAARSLAYSCIAYAAKAAEYIENRHFDSKAAMRCLRRQKGIDR